MTKDDEKKPKQDLTPQQEWAWRIMAMIIFCGFGGFLLHQLPDRNTGMIFFIGGLMFVVVLFLRLYVRDNVPTDGIPKSVRERTGFGGWLANQIGKILH